MSDERYFLSAPLTVNWALSNVCNLRCDHCYSRTERYRDLDTAALLKIADKLADWGVCYVNYGGGEPLLRKDVFEVSARARERGMRVSMNSNGWFVDRDAARRVRDAGLSHVGVSIDHPVEAFHDRLRGAGSYARAIAACEALGAEGVELHLSSLVYRDSLDALDATVALARALGARRLNFLNLKPLGNAARHYAALNPSPAEWERWYREAARWKGEREGLHVALEDPISCSLDDGGPEGALVQGSVCGKLTISIKPDGSITPCGFIGETIGNALADDLEEIWHRHAFLKAMRERTGGEACGGCAHERSCRGGCTARTYALTGTLDAADPNCWVAADTGKAERIDVPLDTLYTA